MKQLNKQQLESILSEMINLEREHPKANVVFDLERNQVLITYPPPKDFYDIPNADTWPPKEEFDALAKKYKDMK